MTRRLGVVGTVLYPAELDPRSGDVRTWSGIGCHFDSVAVIAQTAGRRPRRELVGNVVYILLPQFPRPLDFVGFPFGAFLVAVTLYAKGFRTWTFSDPLRSGLVFLAMRLFPKTHLVVQVQGQLLNMPSNRFGKANALVERFSRFVVRRADVVRVVSRQIEADAVAAGVSPGRIAFVPSRCDTEIFDPRRWSEAGRSLREALPGDPDSPLVGFLGSLNASKGVDTLIAACAKVAESRPLRLVIAGDGPLRSQLDDLASKAGLAVTLLGRLAGDEVPRFLAAVDLLAVPSNDEGLPRVVLEAMAMELPVVASRVGGIPEAIQDSDTGLLTEPGDATALADAIDRVLGDPRLAARLGSAGRRCVVREFEARSGWDRFASLHGGVDARPSPNR
jgi:glycosyltransferase involved in cell wall biosynthesis